MKTLEPTAAEVERFLNGLTELTRRTGILVQACGCCDSPYLVKIENHELVADGEYRAREAPAGLLRWFVAGEEQ